MEQVYPVKAALSSLLARNIRVKEKYEVSQASLEMAGSMA
jgi:hypothetical protein